MRLENFAADIFSVEEEVAAAAAADGVVEPVFVENFAADNFEAPINIMVAMVMGSSMCSCVAPELPPRAPTRPLPPARSGVCSRSSAPKKLCARWGAGSVEGVAVRTAAEGPEERRGMAEDSIPKAEAR